jgi:hypothetical protein
MRVLFLALALLFALEAEARERSVAREFQKANPCPVTGKKSGACPNFERDHVRPLCAGGADHPSNMQWLSVEQHRAKTKVDRKECRR